uniref:Uncharacterized protein n=1 Tax=Falco tinnunculus TaxID=100819 RepID=A0A8C4ULJ8_FALTI
MQSVLWSQPLGPVNMPSGSQASGGLLTVAQAWGEQARCSLVLLPGTRVQKYQLQFCFSDCITLPPSPA